MKNEKTFRDANPQYEEGKPCVYVGQSSLTPHERFKKHKAGYKAGRRYVTNYGKWVKKKNIPDNNPHPSRSAAEKKEKELAEHLRKKENGLCGQINYNNQTRNGF